MRKIVSAGKVIDEGKTRKAKVRFGKLDNFDVGVIRRIIHNLYRENISPSLKKILLQLKEKMNFPYGKTHSSIEHGGTRPFSNIMAPLTLFNEAPKRKSVAPLALKNPYLWLSWPSLMRGYETIFQYVVFLCYYTLVFL